MAFSILQWQQALRSAWMHLKRGDFDRLAISLGRLSMQDLGHAADQESRNEPITNQAVSNLRKHASFTAMQVMGSDTS